MAEGLAAWRRLRALVAGTSPIADGMPFPCPQGQLTVEHMSFGFRGPQPPLLRNVELTVEPGGIIAIVGQSGSGKSTLLRLLVGLYRPSAGGVYLDGHATSQWDRRDFARHVGFLPQQPLLSRGTAAEVIARLEEPDMDLVLDAARRGGAHDVIAGLPNGYATQLSGTYQLSMGQRHRIALARALYGRPKLLLLDELAGSMDSEGEAHVAELLQQLREEGTSVIFTTHRPALVAVADRVLALRNGTLVPAGEELPRLLGVSRMPKPQPQRPAIGGGRGSAAA
jgi:ABC-type protease/lipase transport system fused ATPase/permease subunit